MSNEGTIENSVSDIKKVNFGVGESNVGSLAVCVEEERIITNNYVLKLEGIDFIGKTMTILDGGVGRSREESGGIEMKSKVKTQNNFFLKRYRYRNGKAQIKS